VKHYKQYIKNKHILELALSIYVLGSVMVGSIQEAKLKFSLVALFSKVINLVLLDFLFLINNK
jgi:hypothetical protein